MMDAFIMREEVKKDVENLLSERGDKYGDYGEQSEIVESIIESVRSGPNWDVLPAYMKVAVYLTALKLGRMCTGDPLYDDNWKDIEGYARLVVNELKKA